uniref:LRAT domain-containing protein n=2 Tax=Panagrellus redivivus TaxID=6233 RepID=A0A7E4VUL5_PANRE
MSLVMDDVENDGFKNYVEAVLDNEWMGWEKHRAYGVTPMGRRFVFVISYEVWYAVRLIMEPERDEHGEYGAQQRPLPCTEFTLRSSAEAYVKQEHYELEATFKMGKHRTSKQFDKFVETKIDIGFGSEVYRLRDIDEGGKLFLFVMSKLITYTVLLIREPYLIYDGSGRYLKESEVIDTEQFYTRKSAEDYIHARRNELRGFDVGVEKRKQMTVLNDCPSTNELPDTDFFNLPGNDITNSIRWHAFQSFVELSNSKSFRGEEIYRKYSITEAGQYLVFVVTKLDRYLVRIVLEPDARYYRETDAVEEYSCTFDLPKIKKRLVIDNWVAKNSKLFIDKRKNFLKGWPMGCMQLNITDFDPSNPDAFLRRGDHIRRYLKVGNFNPTYHDGIYLGKGQVAHYTTDSSSKFLKSKGGSGPGVVPIDAFLKGESILSVILLKSPDRCHADIADLAEKLVATKVWDKQYNLAHKNCQTFASLCTFKNGDRIFKNETLSGALIKVLPYSGAACMVLAFTPVSLPIAVAAVAPITAFTIVNRMRKSARNNVEKALNDVNGDEKRLF